MIAKSGFTFTHPLRVRWAECDAQGIVFNGNYFLYFDVGMTEYMRVLGFQGADMLEFFTVHAEADFRAPARFDEEIEIGVRCARIGRTSMTLELVIARDGAVITEGALTYVHAAAESQAALKIPQEFIDKVTAYEKVSPVIKVIA